MGRKEGIISLLNDVMINFEALIIKECAFCIFASNTNTIRLMS